MRERENTSNTSVHGLIEGACYASKDCCTAMSHVALLRWYSYAGVVI